MDETEAPRRWFLITEATLAAFATCIEYGHHALVKDEIDQMLKDREGLTDEEVNSFRRFLAFMKVTRAPV